MLENIIKWIIDNKDSLISGVIGNGIFLGVVQLWILKNKIPKVVKTLTNIKGIKYLGFIVLYILPLGTIVWMIIDKTNEPTFKNIGLSDIADLQSVTILVCEVSLPTSYPLLY